MTDQDRQSALNDAYWGRVAEHDPGIPLVVADLIDQVDAWETRPTIVRGFRAFLMLGLVAAVVVPAWLRPEFLVGFLWTFPVAAAALMFPVAAHLRTVSLGHARRANEHIAQQGWVGSNSRQL